MTAVPSWDIVGPTDAELARAAAAGDRGAFAEIYDRYADRLHDFCVGMLRDRDGSGRLCTRRVLHRRDPPNATARTRQTPPVAVCHRPQRSAAPTPGTSPRNTIGRIA